MEGYQLKISVLGSSQPLWRVIQIPARLTFLDLHLTIQRIFGLDDEYIFRFELEELATFVIKLGDEKTDYFNHKVIFCNEIVGDYLSVGMNFNYFYDLEDNWEFELCVLKRLDDTKSTPEVIDYSGSNLIDSCASIFEYEKIRDNLSKEKLKFKLNEVNESLWGIEAEEVINYSPLKNKYLDVINKLKRIIEKRNLDSCQVIRVHSDCDVYWVIIKTDEGYVIELFENYDNLLQGFYNLQTGALNHAFCHCFTFLLSNKEISVEHTLDQEHKIAAFYNEPGYLPSLIDVEGGKIVLKWLEELLVGLTYDQNTSEIDEIIDIIIKNNNFISSSIYVHEPQIDINDYDFGYRGKERLNTSLELFDQVSIDVICLPTSNTYLTNELQLYAVIATKDDYLIKDIALPEKALMAETLIDIMISFFEQNGKPSQVVVNNLNVLFLILGFLNDNAISYLEDDTDLEIELALAHTFGISDELDEVIENPFIQELIREFEDNNEDEIDIKLEEYLKQGELLN